jgi:hypothetical protein
VDRNLITKAAQQWDLDLLKWLKSVGQLPLTEPDCPNALVAASVEPGYPLYKRKSFDAYDWLVSNGCNWPSQPAKAHALLGNLISRYEQARFRQAVDALKELNVLSSIFSYDANEASRPLIYSVNSVEAILALEALGVNVHQKIIDRRSGAVLTESALVQGHIPVDVRHAFLDRKLSVSASRIGYALFTDHADDVNLVERYLKASLPMKKVEGYYHFQGAPVTPVHFLAQRSSTMPPAQLSALLQLFKKYEVDVSVENEGSSDTSDRLARNLPIHTAISAGATQSLAVWLRETNASPSVKHPRTKASLISYALRDGPLFSEGRDRVIAELVRLGAPLNAIGETLVLDSIRMASFLKKSLVEKLVTAGADLNVIDAKTGHTVLSYLVNAPNFALNDCFSYPRDGLACIFETRQQRLDLIRWFVAQGAQAWLVLPSGKTALDLVREFADVEKCIAYQDALLNAP